MRTLFSEVSPGYIGSSISGIWDEVSSNLNDEKFRRSFVGIAGIEAPNIYSLSEGTY